MKYTLRYRPEIEDDLAEAFAWYEKHEPGLGFEFVRTFWATTAMVERNPRLNRMIFDEFRRALMFRFPYAIWYLIEGSEIVVLLVFHCKRSPKRLARVLKRRRG